MATHSSPGRPMSVQALLGHEPELLWQVFRCLQAGHDAARSCTAVRGVCRQWRALFDTSTTHLTPKSLLWGFAHRYPRLTSVDACRCRINAPSDLLHLASLPRLQALCISVHDPGSRDEILACLQHCSRLTKLVFVGSIAVTGPALLEGPQALLPQLPALRELEVRGSSGLTVEALCELAPWLANCSPASFGGGFEDLEPPRRKLWEVEQWRYQPHIRGAKALQRLADAFYQAGRLTTLALSLHLHSARAEPGAPAGDQLSLLTCLGPLQRLQVLELRVDVPFSCADTRHLQELTSLRQLCLVTFREQPKSSHLGELWTLSAALPRLEKLCLTWRRKTGFWSSAPPGAQEGLPQLGPTKPLWFRALRALSLQGCTFSPGELQHLGTSRLTCLHLCGNLYQSDGADHALPWGVLGQLESLHVSEANPFVAPGGSLKATPLPAELSSLQHLTSLKLRGLVLAGGLGVLAPLGGLQALDLTGCLGLSPHHACYAAIEEDAERALNEHTLLRPLAALGSLTALSLAQTDVEAQLLVQLLEDGAFKGLLELDLSGADVGDKDLAALAACPLLRVLRCDRRYRDSIATPVVGLSTDALKHISQLGPSLRHLSLQGHSLCARGVRDLRALSGLTYLDLRGNVGVDANACLRAIQGCPAMQVLHVGWEEDELDNLYLQVKSHTRPRCVRRGLLRDTFDRLPLLRTASFSPYEVAYTGMAYQKAVSKACFHCVALGLMYASGSLAVACESALDRAASLAQSLKGVGSSSGSRQPR